MRKRSERNRRAGKRLLCLILAGLCLLGASGCSRAGTEQAAEPAVTQDTQLEPVQPQPVAAADGDPKSLLCKASYTASGEALSRSPEDTVAVMGDAALTAGQLQIRYCLAVSAYRQSGKEPAPDFDRPLDAQLCPLAEGLSWQHYFLREALAQWQAQQALLLKSGEPQTVSSEYYEPRQELHERYFSKELPARKYLYESKDCYTPNKLHQAWLDALPETLAKLAEEKGCDSLEALTAAFAGPGAGEEDLLTVAGEVNRSYMYFTECGYAIALSEEELSGAVRQETDTCKTVDIRQCLLIPEGSTAADGTVSDSEESWEACEKEARSLLSSWSKHFLTQRNPEGNFARMTNENSDDAASRVTGGLYTGLREGQLIPELDAWCFDEARQPGDTEILRSDLGCHIVFFRGSSDSGKQEAEQAMRLDAYRAVVEQAEEEFPMSVDYSAIRLGAAEGVQITVDDFLYPDVAHERFPEVMLFLQQDFSRAPYGPGYYVERHGCGITTLAMLATYMTDTVYTPDRLAKTYSIYSVPEGTDGNLFLYTPSDFGFFLDKKSFDWEEVAQALENGQLAVTLQGKGYFTEVGHFMLLAGMNEDGTVVVRDPNIKAYGKLEENKVDGFGANRIYNSSMIYYILEKKITAYPDCSRCGSGVPSTVLTEAYLCEKCTAALARRNGFLSICAGM